MTTAVSLSANPILQFFNNQGQPNSGGYVLTQVGGVNYATYQDSAGTIPLPNPVPLNNRGEVSNAAGVSCQLFLVVGVTYTFTQYDQNGNQINQATFVSAPGGIANLLYASSGSSLVGFIQAGSNAAASDVQTVLRRRFIDADDYISTSNAPGANVAGWAKLVTDVSALANGAHVQVSRGTYLFNGPIAITKKMLLVGEGRQSTIFSFSHTGDGIQSTWPINSSTAAYVGVRDIAIINTNGANTGGGFVDVGGTFVDLFNCYISGFKYEVIFDQTEVATIDQCELVCSYVNGANLWLVNGADHTVGASVGFTNRITVTRNQFNSGASCPWQIIDDGGGNHTIENNNMNSGNGGIRLAGVGNLIYRGNESEGHPSYPMLLTYTTLAGAYVGPCVAPLIEGNGFSDISAQHIYIDDANGGAIRANEFSQASGTNIVFTNGASNRATGLIIEGNSKLVSGAFRQAGAFIGGFTVAVQRNIIRQCAVTYNPLSIAAGNITCTPAVMEAIAPNYKLWCINQDGTNGEWVAVSATNSTTFTAVFTTTKTANFLIYGTTPYDQFGGSVWSPVVTGSGPVGGSTVSGNPIGTYNVVGGKCFFNAYYGWSALTGGAAGQLSFNLPFPARYSGESIAALVTGPTAVGNVCLFLSTTAGSNIAGLAYVISATGAINPAAVGASGSISVSGCYDI